MSAHHDLHGLACAVHGALVALHLLGLAYGVKRKNYGDAAVHAGAACFSIHAALHHVEAVKEQT